MTTSQLLELLRELKDKVRLDPALDEANRDTLMEHILKLQNMLKNGENGISAHELKVESEKLRAVERRLSMLDKIKKIRKNRYPSYFDDFASTLARPPYALPSTLYEPQGKDSITIDIEGIDDDLQRFHEERAELALNLLFPGSTTYRYFGRPVKISTDRWDTNFQARLRGIHNLSQEPIFSVTHRGHKINVYRPQTLRARTLHRFENPRVCLRCLSIIGSDEACGHAAQLKQPLKIPSSNPISLRQELGREVSQSKSFRVPLSSIITRADYVSELRVGIAVLGFERTAPLRNTSRTVVVDYDPPIGIILTTRGVAFHIDVPRPFVDSILQDRPELIRDLIIQELGTRLDSKMKENKIPGYYLDPMLSGLIVALGTDGRDRFNAVEWANRFSSRNWVGGAVEAAMREAHYFERFDIEPSSAQACFESLAHENITIDDIRSEIKERLIHSIAHIILIAGCVTSGSLFNDLGYLVSEEEVVLFDAVNGGNGSCEMIFEFLNSPESFSISEFTEVPEVKVSRPNNPKYFDEAVAELLLPCQQAVADRIFHADLTKPKYQEIDRRVKSLEVQKKAYEPEFRVVQSLPVTQAFQASIGYHLPIEQGIQEANKAERTKEAFAICIHGCPDCIALGSECEASAFQEKFAISKALLDEYYRFATSPFRVPITAGAEKVQSFLAENEMIIVESDAQDAQEEDRVRNMALKLDGKQVGKKFIKFAGFWVDAPLNNLRTTYNAMLVLI